jgi:L-lactate dehydrogenase complex protein LldF
MEIKTAQFKRNAEIAIADDQIQRSLVRVMHHFDEARTAAIAEITPERWEELRERGRKIKDHTVANLDYYLELLAKRVGEAGGVVHFARDAEEVRQIVMRLARSRGVQSVIKSKSMISEEVGLNHVLEQSGIEVTETDLGEYIIQLAEETPFHIVAPAMHKSKEQVSDLFVKHLGEQPEEHIPELAGIARRRLRPKFLAADMGVSGANFAIAETGTIVLVTNEGNGSLTTSLPRIHVALMGMEKVVPTIEDMAIFLRLLGRAASGQRLTTYTTFITGPRRAEDEDGPEEFHLVIVDNGRSRLLRDIDLREALRCIRCGACLNICPVYRKVGGHA